MCHESQAAGPQHFPNGLRPNLCTQNEQNPGGERTNVTESEGTDSDDTLAPS